MKVGGACICKRTYAYHTVHFLCLLHCTFLTLVALSVTEPHTHTHTHIYIRSSPHTWDSMHDYCLVLRHSAISLSLWNPGWCDVMWLGSFAYEGYVVDWVGWRSMTLSITISLDQLWPQWLDMHSQFFLDVLVNTGSPWYRTILLAEIRIWLHLCTS